MSNLTVRSRRPSGDRPPSTLKVGWHNCPRCGASNSPNARYCGVCAKDLWAK